MTIISIYDKEKHTSNPGNYELEQFFHNIKTGVYKDKVNKIRLLKQNYLLEQQRCKENLIDTKTDAKLLKAKELLKEEKGSITRVTVSGKFKKESRQIKDVERHSGYIDIDIDGLDPNELYSLKSKLADDKYCYSVFITCGGDGLAFIVRIDGDRHEDAWEGLKQYIYNNYGKSIDPVHKAINATRNASYDPELFVKDKLPKIFNEYIKPPKKKKIDNTKYVSIDSDFEEIVKEIYQRKIDFCPDYQTFTQIGFAIASRYGINGFNYFDTVCKWGDKYNENVIEREYKAFCKNPAGGINIATFYARCKEFNIEIFSKKTKKITSVASAARKAGKNKEDCIVNLEKFEGLKPSETKEIVEQVFEKEIEWTEEGSLLEEIESFLIHNYELRKNEVTGKLENYGVPLDDDEYNSILIKIKKNFDKADARWVERILFSSFIKKYNPFIEFFQANLDKIPDELLDKGEIPSIIRRLFKSVKTENDAYTLKFGVKWLVSGISGWLSREVSNLELSFTGKIRKGKSFFFENLLPKELQMYFAESSFEKEADAEVLMCIKGIILNDESAGKSKADEKKHKRLLEKKIFSIRRPYRKDLEDLKRIALLCSTSNPQNVLSDVYGNRRIIPINVISRDFKMYDSIDKTELWMAVYYLYKQEFDWRISEDEILELKECTKLNQDYSTEYEAITKYIQHGEEEMTALDIKVFLEDKTRQKFSVSKITGEMKRLEFKMIVSDKTGFPRNIYKVQCVGSFGVSSGNLGAQVSNVPVASFQDRKDKIPDYF